jgi:hypothetical protein
MILIPFFGLLYGLFGTFIWCVIRGGTQKPTPASDDEYVSQEVVDSWLLEREKLWR